MTVDLLVSDRRDELAALVHRTARLESLQATYRQLGEIAATSEIPRSLLRAARALAPDARYALIDKNEVIASADRHGECEMILSSNWIASKWLCGDARDLNAPICCGVKQYACASVGRTRLSLYVDGLERIDEAFVADFQAFVAFAGVVVNAVRVAEADRKAATTDALTGLWNRRALEYQLRVAVDEGKPFTYAIIDLDKFKQINDTMGHQAGDAVLKNVGETLRKRTRAADYPARLAGDEFVVLLEDGDGSAAADRIRGWLAEAGIAASVGVARFPDDGTDPQTLYAAADQKLYQAKHKSRVPA